MSIDNTLLTKEIEEVLANAQGHSGDFIEVKIKAGELWTSPYRLDYLFLSRGYATGELGDVRTIEILMPHGDFVYDLLPHKDNLLVEVSWIPLTVTGSEYDTSARIVTKRFRGIINAKGMQDPNLTNKTATANTRESLNHVSALPVQIQLIDESVYLLYMTSTGTTFRRVTPMQALLNVYSRYVGLLGDAEDTRITAIEYREGHTQEIRNQINIPDGTPFKDVHTILQDHEGGIYTTGIGRYIQNQILYVYPLFNTEDYRNNTKILNVINVPNERFTGAETTYLDSDTQLTILATGDASTVDKSLADNLQHGNALRFTDARTILTTNGITEDNRLLVDRATNLSEVSLAELGTGVNNTKWSTQRVTSNPFRQYTELARRRGVQLTLEWTKGSVDLLVPGMPVKYRTIADDLVKVYYGVLLGVTENRIPSNKGIVNTRFEGIVTMSIFINRMETLENV